MTSAEVFDHAAACDYIANAAKYGSRPGLSRIRKLCALLGDPQDDLRFIHIAGTNGKGSVAAMIASVLSHAGVRAGMYYSPALTCIRDHFAIDGKLIFEEDYAEAVSVVAEANEKMIRESGESATQFELETALAFVYFRKNHCDAVVLECGMGGGEDATNIVRNKICCVITSVSYDHMQYLGNTLSEIASAKAGIITPHCPVIAFDSSEESTDVIRKKCRETGSSLYLVKKEDVLKNHVRTALAGDYQADNAAVAVKTIGVIRDNDLIPDHAINDDAIVKGLAKVRWPFRFEKICNDPPVYVDGAHNPDAAARLLKTIQDELCGCPVILVIGVFADKEYEKVVKTMSECAHAIITLQTPDNPRALDAAKLAKCAEKYCGNVKVSKGIDDACTLAFGEARVLKNGVIVACGSLSYLNDFTLCVRKYSDAES